MMSATCSSRSLSETVLDTELPIEARTRVETTEDSVDLGIDDNNVPRGFGVGVRTLMLFTSQWLNVDLRL